MEVEDAAGEVVHLVDEAFNHVPQFFVGHFAWRFPRRGGADAQADHRVLSVDVDQPALATEHRLSSGSVEGGPYVRVVIVAAGDVAPDPSPGQTAFRQLAPRP